MTEIKYTTHPEGPPLSRARTEVIYLTVRAPFVRAASPAALQQVSASANLPIRAVRALADADLPIIVGRAAYPADADRLAAELHRRTDLSIDVHGPPGLAAWMPAAAAAGAGVLALLLGLLWTFWVALLAVPAFVASAWWALRAMQPADLGPLLESEHRGRDATAAAPELWTAIVGVRQHSLDRDLPIDAQVAVWTRLERLEEDVASGTIEPHRVLEALQEARQALGSAQTVRRDLAQTPARGRASVSEGDSA